MRWEAFRKEGGRRNAWIACPGREEVLAGWPVPPLGCSLPFLQELLLLLRSWLAARCSRRDHKLSTHA